MVQIEDLQFKPLLSAEIIKQRIAKMASDINNKHQGSELIFIAVLNGAFRFASDLMGFIDLPCKISFLKLASYQGAVSGGKVKKLIGLNEDLTNKRVIVLEDIVDTGRTLVSITEQLKTYNPKSIEIASLLLKPEMYQENIPIDYTGFEIPNEFVVGYGLDYNGYGRNMNAIYSKM